MLLFIVVLGKRDIKPFIFQYISCYCLSSYGKYGIDNLVKFQYISCYCLSKCLLNMQYVFRISIHLMLLFIITCACIVERTRKISIHLMLLFIQSGYSQYIASNDFNTSHVTVYQIKQCKLLSSCVNFNTSHVTVYP